MHSILKIEIDSQRKAGKSLSERIPMRLTGFWVVPLKSVATIKCTTFIAGERKNAIKTQHKMKKYLTIVGRKLPAPPSHSFSILNAMRQQNEKICPCFSRFSRGKQGETGQRGGNGGLALGLGLGLGLEL